MTAGLGPTDGGSLTVDRNALVERWSETFGLDLAQPIDGALVVQEVGHVAGLVDAAVAAERQRVADELRALLADRGALHRWLAAHGLADAGPGVVLAVLMRDLRGTCSACRGPAEFVAGGPAFEQEASSDRHGGDAQGGKPLDAYPTDQTGVSESLRATQDVSAEGASR